LNKREKEREKEREREKENFKYKIERGEPSTTEVVEHVIVAI